MAETGRNKSQLAEYLGVSKGYVSQLLNGDYDHCMSKFFELALAFGMAQEGETDCPYCLYCLLKKNKRAKNNPLVLLFIFCFLRFLYNRLFPIILVFSNCILYIGFSQLYWFFPIVFYILAFPNYIVFFPNCLYSAPVNCPIKKMAPVARSFMM